MFIKNLRGFSARIKEIESSVHSLSSALRCKIISTDIKQGFSLTVVAALLITLVLSPTPLYAQEDGNPNPFACYGVGDEWLSADGTENGAFDPNGSETDFDYLALVDRLTGVATPIGPTGTRGIEAMAFVPDAAGPTFNILYSVANETNADDITSDTLGTIDLATGEWTPLNPGTLIGSGNGPDGSELTVFDIDGLTYDVQRQILWATQRNVTSGEPDYLLQIDPATGLIVTDAFGAGIDWVPVEVATDPAFVTSTGDPYDDIDDLSVDPVTGRMFIIMNKGGEGGGLVELDPVDGSVISYIGVFTTDESEDGIADDIEGLSFFNDGQLYGSSGNNGPQPTDNDRLYTIDVESGEATLVDLFPAGVQDIEALGCLTAPAFIDLEKATNGEDADFEPGPTISVGGEVVWTYVIENIGAVPLINLTLTDNILGDITNSCAEGDLPNTLNPADTFTCTVTGVADTVGQYENIGTIEASYEAPGPDGTVTIPIGSTDPSHYVGILDLAPGIDIVKTAGDAADGETHAISEAGLVTFKYEVTNTGNTYLTDIVIDDDAGTPDIASDDVTTDSTTCPDLAGPLEPQGVVICTAEIQVDADATNIAGTTGTPSDADGNPLPNVDPPTATDDAVVEFIGIPGISIVKTAGDAADGETHTINEAGLVTFKYEVMNTGTTYLTDIVIDDDAGTPDIASDDVTTDSTSCPDLAGPLEPQGVVICTAEIQVVADATNVAGTTGTPSDADGNPLPDVDPPTATDDAVVEFVGEPSIALEKSVYAGHDGGASCPGGELVEATNGSDVTYCFAVVNTGTTYQNNITINDPDLAVVLTSPDLLAPGESVMLFHEATLDAALVNTADATGTPSDENGDPIPGLENPPATDTAEVIPLAQIGNIVWLDQNTDGIQDADEEGIGGVVVTLYDEDGNVVDTIVTDAQGNYVFNVEPGTYSLGFDTETSLGPGYFISPQDSSADDAVDSDADQIDGRTITTALVVGESDLNWDTGIFAPPILEVSKSDNGAVVQPGGTILYTINYSNTGTSDATGVVITESIPQFTSFAPEMSTPGWNCENGSNTSGTACTFEVGNIAKGSTGRLVLSFVVFIDRFIPEDVSVINNIIQIADDGTNGTPPTATQVIELSTPVFRPTSIELIDEPMFDTTLNNLFIPMMIMR